MTPDFLSAAALTACAAGYLLLGVRQFARRAEGGSAASAITLFLVALWTQGGVIELRADSPAAFALARAVHFIGAASLPLLLLVCFRAFIGKPLEARKVGLLAIVPAITAALAASNRWHGLMWDPAGVGAYPLPSGPWFAYVHAPYSYALVLVAMTTLLVHSFAVPPSHRRGILRLFGAALAPLIAMAAHDAGLAPAAFPAVPAVFALLLPIYAWLFIGERITEFTPLAYATVFQHMQDPVIVVDDRRRIIGMNHGAELLLDRREDEALRASLDTVFGPGVTEVVLALNTGLPQKLMTDSGRFLHLRVSPIAAGNPMSRSGRVLMFRDVSDVEKAQKEVLSSEKLLRTVIDHSANGILRLRRALDDQGHHVLRCIFANASAGKYLNAPSGALLDRSAGELANIAGAGRAGGPDAAAVLRECLQAAEAGGAREAEIRMDDGGEGRWLQVIAEAVGDDVAITLVDVTDGKAKAQQMESIAWFDPLTGVLNRRGFERDAARRLSESDDLAPGALLFIDLNEFKQVNDRFGHAAGDQLLVVAAERLQQALRSCDIIGRPGGDEFVALVPDVRPDLAESLAQRLTASLEQPYLINGETLCCTASIGLALYPEHANTLTGLLRAADQAMYRAKARTRGSAGGRRVSLLEKAG